MGYGDFWFYYTNTNYYNNRNYNIIHSTYKIY